MYSRTKRRGFALDPNIEITYSAPTLWFEYQTIMDMRTVESVWLPASR